MADFSFSVPDDEVEFIEVTRYTALNPVDKGTVPRWRARLTHRFGWAMDRHGRLPFAVAPQGAGSGPDPQSAVDRALANLREQVRLGVLKSNERPLQAAPSLKADESVGDLLKLLDL